jgi:hypothetical protein
VRRWMVGWMHGWVAGWMDGRNDWWVDGFPHSSVLSYINEAFALTPDSITPANFLLITMLVGWLFNNAVNIQTIKSGSYDD